MSLSSRSRWIPYVLAAVGMHLLLAARRLQAPNRPAMSADAPAAFMLLGRPPGMSGGAQSGPLSRSPRADAIRRADVEIAGADPKAYWVGSYAAPTCCPGEFDQLLLGTSTYVVVHVGGYGEDPAEPEVLEYGHYRLEADCVHFDPTAVPGPFPQAHELVLLREFGSCLLATYDQVPGAFYDPRKADSPFSMGCQASFYRQGGRFEPDVPPILPECYRREWNRSQHLRVEEVIPIGEPGTIAHVRLSRTGLEAVPSHAMLWWDGEVCTEVRAFVSEIRPTEVLALLDVPLGMSPQRIRVGTTFSRLPRLE